MNIIYKAIFLIYALLLFFFKYYITSFYRFTGEIVLCYGESKCDNAGNLYFSLHPRSNNAIFIITACYQDTPVALIRYLTDLVTK